MKKVVVIIGILAILLGIFTFQTKVYAADEKVLDNETESQLVQIKEEAANSLEDYQQKYGSDAYGLVAYILNLVRIYSIPFCFLGIAIGAIHKYVIGIRKLDTLEKGMGNVAFLRTNIELIAHFFAPGEVSEIWITFPDPQMKKVNKRLTSTRFMKLYREILTTEGIIHLKTDSNFLYTYTCAMVSANGYKVLVNTDDLYHSGLTDKLLSITTYYEQQWLDRGITIKYISFVCEERESLVEPDIEIEMDSYRSFNRSKRSALASSK